MFSLENDTGLISAFATDLTNTGARLFVVLNDDTVIFADLAVSAQVSNL